MQVPLLAGSKITVVSLDDTVELLLPPPPAGGLGDVETAVRDALRAPLDGKPLEALAPSNGRVTILLDSWALPLPAPLKDPRRAALAAVSEELRRVGVPSERQTILVAGGLARRASPAELEARLGGALSHRLAGRILVHDVEDPDLAEIADGQGNSVRISRVLVEGDLVVSVTAAESAVDGGPGALLGAAGVKSARQAVDGPSLLAANGSAWDAAVAIERALTREVPLIGVSLALAHPVWDGALRGVPYQIDAVERFASSQARRAFSLLPSPVRRRVVHTRLPEVGTTQVVAGSISGAHLAALERVTATRGLPLAEPLDGLVMGVPPVTPYPPLERANPLDAAYLGLGHALRLWRGRFPVVEGGTLVIQHRLHRRFAHPTQAPHRVFFASLRPGASLEPSSLTDAEEAAAREESAIAAYREGRSCHPRLPFAQWEACAPARQRLGAVLVAGCRDATAARRLGFVPVRGLRAALEMARARRDGDAHLGALLTPPFFPLLVSS